MLSHLSIGMVLCIVLRTLKLMEAKKHGEPGLCHVAQAK